MYVGSTAHFGYLDYDHRGKVNYQNLLTLVDTTLKVGIIWSVKQTPKYVYFQLRNGIIEYDPLANKVKLYRVPNSKSRFGGDFVFQDRYYVRLGDYGLLQTEKDTLTVASSFFLNKNTFKTTALWDKDTLLLPTHKEGVYLFSPKNGYISPKMMFSDTSFMADNSLSFPLNYGNDQYFLFASGKKGGVLFDKKRANFTRI